MIIGLKKSPAKGANSGTPHGLPLGSGNIFVFSAVRFVTGLLFATGPVGNLYVQDVQKPILGLRLFWFQGFSRERNRVAVGDKNRCPKWSPQSWEATAVVSQKGNSGTSMCRTACRPAAAIKRWPSSILLTRLWQCLWPPVVACFSSLTGG